MDRGDTYIEPCSGNHLGSPQGRKSHEGQDGLCLGPQRVQDAQIWIRFRHGVEIWNLILWDDRRCNL